jgi:hypothetical protein
MPEARVNRTEFFDEVEGDAKGFGSHRAHSAQNEQGKLILLRCGHIRRREQLDSLRHCFDRIRCGDAFDRTPEASFSYDALLQTVGASALGRFGSRRGLYFCRIRSEGHHELAAINASRQRR